MSEEPAAPPQARFPELVLDTSAVIAWMRGSEFVGALLARLDREGGAVIVPLVAQIEASAAESAELDWLRLLVDHPAAFLVGESPQSWEMLAGVRQITGSYDLAVAAWLAIEAGVPVLTRHGDRYAALEGGVATVPIED